MTATRTRQTVAKPASSTRGRLIAVAVVAVLLLGAAVGYAAWQRLPGGRPTVLGDPTLTLQPGDLVVRDKTSGLLSRIRDGKRRESTVPCSRAYAGTGRIICLQQDPESLTSYQVSVLDLQLKPIACPQVSSDPECTLPINGLPTRARVSADGRVLAWTVFVSGDSYLSSGFSTRTGVLDLSTGVLANTLEDFTIDGRSCPLTRTSGESASPATTTPSTRPWRPVSTSTSSRAAWPSSPCSSSVTGSSAPRSLQTTPGWSTRSGCPT